MAKADLVRDAKARGLVLTGDETVADLELLLEQAGESAADVEAEANFVEPDPAVAEAEQNVAAARQAVVDAQTALGEAKAAHDEAVAAHSALTAPPLPVVGKQYLVEGSAEPRDIPTDVLADSGQYPRRIMVNGSSYEHVSDAPGVDAEGKPAIAWVYRKM